MEQQSHAINNWLGEAKRKKALGRHPGVRLFFTFFFMSKQKQNVLAWGLSVFAAATLVACGGGGGGGSGSATTGGSSSISGVAATGAPLVNATVTVKDKNGVTRTATTDFAGAYTISDAASLVAPLVLRAQGIVGGESVTIYGVLPTALTATNVVNITPATQAILEQAASALGSAVFDNNAFIASIDATKVNDANNALRTVLGDVLTKAGADNGASLDFIKTPFKADSKGLDKVFDLYQINTQVNSTKRDVVVADKASGTITIIESGKGSPKPITPNAGAELDLAALRDWFTAFNKAMENGGKGLPDLFDQNFKHGGKTRDDLIEWLPASTRLKSPSVAGCLTKSEVSVCSVVAEQDGKRFSMPFLYDRKSGTNAWKATGNQYELDFEISPKLRGWYKDNGGAKDVNVFHSGVAVSMDLGANEKSYKAVSVAYSLNPNLDSPEWRKLAVLTPSSKGCNNSGWSVKGTCSDFVEVADADVALIEQARKAGTFKLRVSPLFYIDDSNTGPEDKGKVFDTRLYGMSALLGSDAQRKDVRDLAAVKFNGPDLTTGVLTFSANNANGFGLYESWVAGGDTWENKINKFTKAQVAALNGTVTIKKPGVSWVNAWLAGRVNYGATGVAYEVQMKDPNTDR